MNTCGKCGKYRYTTPTPNSLLAALPHWRNIEAVCGPCLQLASDEIHGTTDYSRPEPTWGDLARRFIKALKK